MKKPSAKNIKTPIKNKFSEPQLLATFIQTMQSVKIETEEAKLNETTMSDNNGKRIIYSLTEDMIKNRKEQ